MFEDPRQKAFEKVEAEILGWWQQLDKIGQKDKITAFLMIEQKSLEAVFKAIISEVDIVFAKRDEFDAPEIELQAVMDRGLQSLAKLLSYSNIKSGRSSWLTAMVGDDGTISKSTDEIRERLKAEKAKPLIPVWKREGVVRKKDADDDTGDSDVPIWLR